MSTINMPNVDDSAMYWEHLIPDQMVRCYERNNLASFLDYLDTRKTHYEQMQRVEEWSAEYKYWWIA